MPDGLVDQREIATKLSQRAIDRIITIGEKAIKEYWGRYKNRDASTYADYLVRKGVQANAVRNFIYDRKSASLYDIYVPATIADRGGQYTGDDLLLRLCAPEENPRNRAARCLAIVGNAGTGKSLFLKHAFFKIQKIDANKIPVLIEVRTFNRLPLADLETRIYEDFGATGTAVIREQIVNGLQSGLFAILLDGMDELKGPVQKHYEAALIEFLRKFALCPVLISSRPIQRMLSWADVDVFPIAPLTIAAAEDLITRLEFNEKVKGNFTKLLRKDLFRTHYEFVSVPLLCTIMLLTYSDSGYISKNRHEFFEDAFTALWSKHDGRKDDFERHRYTGLQKNEFSKILTAFAMSSYSSADYNMRESHFHRHFEAAIRLSGVSCKEEDFLQDLTISTSLAVQDGPYIRFCHRAFQEYFSALFIREVNDAIVGRLTEEIPDRLETDNVLSFVLSINDEKIEKNWILPSVSMISDFVEASDRDLDGYARVIIEGDDEISRTMYKIRVLYQFDPPFQLLASAYDAARDMRIPVSRVVGLGEKPNLFQRDRRNFVYWTERLISKYERRSSALDELIDRTQLEAKTETES